MATKKLNLSREQLATFLKNHEQIKQFEALFRIADEVSPQSDTTAIAIQAGNAESLAQAAVDQLARIANALELLAAAPVTFHNNSIVTDYIDLPELGPHATQPRRVQWNANDGTLDVGLYGGVVLQCGQELHYYAKNTTGSVVLNGSPVMFTGSVGASGKLEFGLAVADGSVPSEYMMGVATQDIPNGEFGYITSFGLVRGFDTTGSTYGEVWADGDLLYFDPITPGAWTNVTPVAPNISVPVAVVINAGSGGSGSIFVRMELSESLGRLQDVHINGSGVPLAGEVLIYDATQKVWENHHISPGSNITITNADGAITIATSGATGSFTAASGQTISVNNGVITSII